MSNHTEHQDVDGQGPDIEGLARQFQDGDTAAFDALVNACESRVFNLAYRIVNSYEDATEVTQDVFVKVHRSIAKFKGRSKFTTWVYSITANTCRNRLRRRKRIRSFEACSLDDTGADDSRTSPLFQAVDPNPDASEAHRRSELIAVVEESMASLPYEFRTVMVMRDLQNMTYEEISTALRCSLGTVKSRLSRARNMTQLRLQQLGITPATVGAAS
jgi:RNA polymerase sigma-70 factor (ECF subfamily)